MHRVLAGVGEVRERRNVRTAMKHATPSLVATAPNQVWTWDITKFATTQKGVFFHASRSFSRPRVSADNAFSESQFKAMKYQPDYPGRFGSEIEAKAWMQGFVGWYNEEHHHAGLALFTPSDVFHGRVDEILATRQAALDAAYDAHPERFPNGPPRARRPPARVCINPTSTVPEVEGPHAAKSTASDDHGDTRANGFVSRPSIDGAELQVSELSQPSLCS